ncbi:MAG: hypothetical protein HKL90_05215 [Elusimicrobia bacterium]|nr:hypothetical protein [Elusimicrobiota bacterium]
MTSGAELKARLARAVFGSSARPSEDMTAAFALEGGTLALAAVEKTRRPDGSRSAALLLTRRVLSSQPAADAAAVREFLAACPKAAASPQARRLPPESMRWVVVLARRHAVIRLLELPSVDVDELKAMARLQALPGLPFQEEEIVSDVVVLDADVQAGRSKVLFALVRKSALASYLELFERLGRWPDGFVLDTMGAAEFMRRKKDPAPADFLQLGLEEGCLNVDAYAGGQLRASRSIPCGHGAAEPARIVAECRRTLTSAPTDGPVAAPKFLFVAGRAPGDAQAFGAELEKEFGAAVEFLSDRSADPPQASPAVVGAAYAGAESSLMLLPDEVLEKRSRHETRRAVAGAAVWLGVWLALLAGIGGGRLLAASLRLSALDAQLKRLQPDAGKAPGVFEQEDILRGHAEAGTAPLDILRELHRSAPSGVTLRSVSRASDGNVMIQGSAPNLGQVMAFVNGLQKSSLFSWVELHDSSRRAAQNVESVDFQVQGGLKGAARTGGVAFRRRRT